MKDPFAFDGRPGPLVTDDDVYFAFRLAFHDLPDVRVRGPVHGAVTGVLTMQLWQEDRSLAATCDLTREILWEMPDYLHAAAADVRRAWERE